MEPEDSDRGILPYCRGFNLHESRAAVAGETDEGEILGYMICALRELFEEAGIVLAYTTSGELLATDTSRDRDRFVAYRRSTDDKEVTMTELARREGLFYALDQLFFVDRWITPEARNIRFDTCFYLAFCPKGQQASSDRAETVKGIWMSPYEALEANLKGTIALSPPAVETLEMLSPFENRASLLEFLNNRKPRTVLPVLTEAVDGPVILFPWDREYELLRQAGITQPGPSRLRKPGEKTTRVLLKDGRWLPCRPEGTFP